MPEYIEREALYRRIRAFAAGVIFRGCEEMLSAKDSCNPVEWSKGYEQGVKDSSTIIATQSAADVAPVVHGRWIRRGNEKKCSVCGFIYYSNNDEWNGCPNCLAKMDGR